KCTGCDDPAPCRVPSRATRHKEIGMETGRGWLAAILLAVAGAAGASGGGGVKLDIDPNMLTEGFLGAHPDLRWQRDGMRSYERGDYEIALAQFKRSALHAGKFAQAMIATMYWDGIGVERDRPLAYAWMDIAAERMYPDLV